MIIDARLAIAAQNQLGEGPIWHPGRNQLLWVDINACQLFIAEITDDDGHVVGMHQFEDSCSAIALVDESRVVVAIGTSLFLVSIGTGASEHLIDLDADAVRLRSNDGRVDRKGGFWISTMGRQAEIGAGAVYRYHRGRLSKLFDGLTIPNSICFSPDGSTAYLCDGGTGEMMKCPLDAATGLPSGSLTTFHSVEKPEEPDGSVVDAQGCLWNARWAGGRVVRLSPQGEIIEEIRIPALRPTCPAFVGGKMDKLAITTANMAADDQGGGLYLASLAVEGIAESYLDL
ncbi:SMP-30/gluconolactonase/LRE family protein [Cucumibacter marinus]|uniref:SMP-30/gluconolactonase/LRE family protein n=1 Tax=Cucumibacter marinus TaxID=1121252 RepID=UPI0003F4DB10|nr:SMP-30/gluconolactonase/LRE family protein [Cucumibacter marinus]